MVLTANKYYELKKIIKIGIIVLIVIGSGVGFWKYTSIKNAVAKENQRRSQINSIRAKFLADESATSTAEVHARFPGLLDDKDKLYPKCPENDEYYKLVDKDTRDMSIAELQRAMDLHPKCAYVFHFQKVSAAADFNTSISNLFSYIPKQELSKASDLVKQISSNWRKIYDKENELITNENASIDAQNEYWISELDSKKGKSSIALRNERFKKLNDDSDNRSKKTDEINDEIKTYKSNATDLLN